MSQGYGVVFKLTPSGQYTILHAFDGSDGAAPHALAFGSGGLLYGGTADGGPNGVGVIFELAQSSQ